MYGIVYACVCKVMYDVCMGAWVRIHTLILTVFCVRVCVVCKNHQETQTCLEMALHLLNLLKAYASLVVQCQTSVLMVLHLRLTMDLAQNENVPYQEGSSLLSVGEGLRLHWKKALHERQIMQSKLLELRETFSEYDATLCDLMDKWCFEEERKEKGLVITLQEGKPLHEIVECDNQDMRNRVIYFDKHMMNFGRSMRQVRSARVHGCTRICMFA